VRLFDSVSDNAVWSPGEKYDLWYVIAALGRCSL